MRPLAAATINHARAGLIVILAPPILMLLLTLHRADAPTRLYVKGTFTGYIGGKKNQFEHTGVVQEGWLPSRGTYDLCPF